MRAASDRDKAVRIIEMISSRGLAELGRRKPPRRLVPGGAGPGRVVPRAEWATCGTSYPVAAALGVDRVGDLNRARRMASEWEATPIRTATRGVVAVGVTTIPSRLDNISRWRRHSRRRRRRIRRCGHCNDFNRAACGSECRGVAVSSIRAAAAFATRRLQTGGSICVQSVGSRPCPTMPCSTSSGRWCCSR